MYGIHFCCLLCDREKRVIAERVVGARRRKMTKLLGYERVMNKKEREKGQIRGMIERELILR